MNERMLKEELEVQMDMLHNIVDEIKDMRDEIRQKGHKPGSLFYKVIGKYYQNLPKPNFSYPPPDNASTVHLAYLIVTGKCTWKEAEAIIEEQLAFM